MTPDSSLATRVSPRPFRLNGLAARRLTRAHLAVQERADPVMEGRRLLEEVRKELAAHLEVPQEVEARLLDAVVPEARIQTGAAFALLALSSAGAPALLEVELPFLVALLGRIAGGRGEWAPATRLTRIEEAAFGFVLLVVLAAVRQGGAVSEALSPRLVGMTLERAEALRFLDARRPHVGIELVLRVGDVPGTARVLLPEGALRVPLEALPRSHAGEPAAEVLEAAVPARCLVGRVPISMVELMRIEPGDVVTFAGLQRTGEGLLGPGRLLAPLFELCGDFSRAGFTVSCAIPRIPTQEHSMSATLSEKDEQTEFAPSLPVDVEVELTRVRLTLAGLSRLRPGSVLPLHLHGAEPVLLRVGDRVVARAELVDIEGEVGARILAMLP